MTHATRFQPALALVAALALLLISAGIVSAHATLKSSIPAANSTVTSAPKTVVAVFDDHDALKAAGSVLKVTDTKGATVDKGDSALDKSDAERKTLVVSLKDGLGDGSYTVHWTAVSEGDGDTEEGSFKFSVGSAPVALPTTAAGDALPLASIATGAALLLGLGLELRRRIAR